jgi:hypothetical protein
VHRPLGKLGDGWRHIPSVGPPLLHQQRWRHGGWRRSRRSGSCCSSSSSSTGRETNLANGVAGIVGVGAGGTHPGSTRQDVGCLCCHASVYGLIDRIWLQRNGNGWTASQLCW